MSRSIHLILCIVLVLTMAVVLPARPAAAKSADDVSTSLFMLEPHYGRTLLPLNPTTLADMTTRSGIQFGGFSMRQQSPSIFTSADGHVLAAVYYAAQSPTRARSITIRVVDTGTGAPRTHFHPQKALFVQGMTTDGSQLYGLSTGQTAPTDPATWYLLNASNGWVGASVHFAHVCCRALQYDAVHKRLYAMEVPSLTDAGQRPGAPTLLEYDVTSGQEIGRLVLNGMVSGSGILNDNSSDVVFESWWPGFALSPDGSQIAVLDGTSNRLDLIDATRMTVVRTETVNRPQSALERLAGWLGVAPATAEAKTMRGMSIDLSFSSDGRFVFASGSSTQPGQGSTDRGLQAIDIGNGRIVAEGLTGTRPLWMHASADGKAIYTLTRGPTPGTLCPCMLSRLDVATLSVTAQRTLGDEHWYPELYILPGE